MEKALLSIACKNPIVSTYTSSEVEKSLLSEGWIFILVKKLKIIQAVCYNCYCIHIRFLRL